MERTLLVRTGESIAIRFELAGLGSRFLAMFIDLAIQIVVAFVAVVALGFAAAPLSRAVSALHVPGRLGYALAVAAISAVVFLLFFGYFIAFETAWNGSTPGKRAVGIRVVRDGGFPLDFTSAVVRNLIRSLEFAFGFYAVSAIAVLLSSSSKRLGDYAAGTIVVRDRASESFASAAGGFDASHSRIGDLSDDDWTRLHAFLARREMLEPAARMRLAAGLAAVLRPKLRANLDHLDDDTLLGHVAATGALP